MYRQIQTSKYRLCIWSKKTQFRHLQIPVHFLHSTKLTQAHAEFGHRTSKNSVDMTETQYSVYIRCINTDWTHQNQEKVTKTVKTTGIGTHQ